MCNEKKKGETHAVPVKRPKSGKAQTKTAFIGYQNGPTFFTL